MSGTISGGRKAVKTNKRRHGDDFYKRIGAIGGSKSAKKGFAIDDRTLLDKLLKRPSRASRAGRVGGKRGKVQTT